MKIDHKTLNYVYAEYKKARVLIKSINRPQNCEIYEYKKYWIFEFHGVYLLSRLIFNLDQKNLSKIISFLLKSRQRPHFLKTKLSSLNHVQAVFILETLPQFLTKSAKILGFGFSMERSLLQKKWVKFTHLVNFSCYVLSRTYFDDFRNICEFEI